MSGSCTKPVFVHVLVDGDWKNDVVQFDRAPGVGEHIATIQELPYSVVALVVHTPRSTQFTAEVYCVPANHLDAVRALRAL